MKRVTKKLQMSNGTGMDSEPTANQGSPSQQQPQDLPTGTADDYSRETGGTVLVVYYCWSCGLTLDPEHTSATCCNKKRRHKDEATFNNRMGGCERLFLGDNRRRGCCFRFIGSWFNDNNTNNGSS